MKKIFLFALLLSLPTQAAKKEPKLEHNKRIVREFYDLAFNQKKPIEAAKKYLDVNYKQHNPHVADKRQGFIDAFKAEEGKPDNSIRHFKRFIAEDDLVVLHSHGIENPSDPKDRGFAVMDIFRVKGDLITEHWDVGKKVPEEAKNANTMF